MERKHIIIKKSKRGEETQIEKDSEVLANKIQNRVVEALHTRDRKIKRQSLTLCSK